MELLTPGVGLIVWQAFIFLLLILILKKVAWTPILNSLKIREESIQEALDSAKSARDEMVDLKSENEKLMAETRVERDGMLKEAADVASKIRDTAREDAIKINAKVIEDAKSEIQSEKKAALAEVRNQVVSLSVEIAEKLILETLKDKGSQTELVERYLKDKSFN